MANGYLKVIGVTSDVELKLNYRFVWRTNNWIAYNQEMSFRCLIKLRNEVSRTGGFRYDLVTTESLFTHQNHMFLS